jgi:hypothetical protein
MLFLMIAFLIASRLGSATHLLSGLQSLRFRKPRWERRPQGRYWSRVCLRHISQIRPLIVKTITIQMHKLMPRRTATKKRLSYELVHIYHLLIRT